MANKKVINILSFDVEDYFQINAFSDVIRYKDWDSFGSRVEKNTIKILDLLDQRSEPDTLDPEPLNPKHRATFFILGWISERFPALVKEIHNRGHEVACHGYAHQVIFKQDRNIFKDDVKRAKEILEDITGIEVIGYRAPTYSITQKTSWAIQALIELGFKYDSSIFPIKHDVYGWSDSPRFSYLFIMNGEKYEIQPLYHSDQQSDCKNNNSIIEFPISTYKFLNKNIPVAGGGYFRLFPYPLTKYFLQTINEKEKESFIFYLHPWEIDPDIPKVNNAKAFSKFRTYVNLDKTFARLKRLVSDFDFTSFKDII